MREIHKTHVQRSNLEMMPDLILEFLFFCFPKPCTVSCQACLQQTIPIAMALQTWRRSRKGANKNKELMSAFATTL